MTLGIRQRGLVVLPAMLAILLLVSLLLRAGYATSDAEWRAAGNAWARQQAVAAASQVMEARLAAGVAGLRELEAGRTWSLAQAAEGAGDYRVTEAPAKCLWALPLAPGPVQGVTVPATAWDSRWQLRATLSSQSSGASATLVLELRQRLAGGEQALLGHCPGFSVDAPAVATLVPGPERVRVSWRLE